MSDTSAENNRLLQKDDRYKTEDVNTNKRGYFHFNLTTVTYNSYLVLFCRNACSMLSITTPRMQKHNQPCAASMSTLMPSQRLNKKNYFLKSRVNVILPINRYRYIGHTCIPVKAPCDAAPTACTAGKWLSLQTIGLDTGQLLISCRPSPLPEWCDWPAASVTHRRPKWPRQEIRFGK